MKTAISVPAETFEQVEAYAAALGLSRSEFYTRAAQHYLRELETESLAAQINEALDLADDDDFTVGAVVAGCRSLAESAGDW